MAMLTSAGVWSILKEVSIGSHFSFELIVAYFLPVSVAPTAVSRITRELAVQWDLTAAAEESSGPADNLFGVRRLNGTGCYAGGHTAPATAAKNPSELGQWHVDTWEALWTVPRVGPMILQWHGPVPHWMQMGMGKQSITTDYVADKARSVDKVVVGGTSTVQ